MLVSTGGDIGWCDEHQKRRGKLEKIGGRRIPFRFGTSWRERSVVTKISQMRRRKFKVWSPRGHGRKPLVSLGTFKPFPDSTSRWISLSVRMLSLKASKYWSALTEDLHHCQIASVEPLRCIDRRFVEWLVCLGYSTGAPSMLCGRLMEPQKTHSADSRALISHLEVIEDSCLMTERFHQSWRVGCVNWQAEALTLLFKILTSIA